MIYGWMNRWTEGREKQKGQEKVMCEEKGQSPWS